MSAKRTSPGYYVAVVLLGALLIAAVALVVAMVARPGSPGASVLAVTDQIPITCQTKEKGTTCFETQVTNNGSSKSTFHCEVRSTGDAVASLVGGSTTTDILLDVDQSVHLDSQVVTSDGSEGTAPTVTCEALSV